MAIVKPATPKEIIAAKEYVGADCTLDGAPAMVVGRRLDFAVIATIDGARRYEWAWPTVGRIMARDGAFRSH